MPDKHCTSWTDAGPVTKKFKDMGDGTFAELVVVSTTVEAAPQTDLALSTTAPTNTPATLTLTGAAGKTTYIAGWSVTIGTGAAGPSGLITIGGTIAGTLNYQLGGGASGANMERNYSRPIPAAGPNTAIVLNVPAFGPTTGVVALVIRGYRQ